MTNKDITKQNRINIGFSKNKNSWKSSPAIFNENSLRIQGHPVMENWEEPYMKELARIACSKGGVVLEAGFGMGIAAGYIDQAKIKKHIIIEANHEVADKARDFARQAKIKTEIIEGFAEDLCDQFPDCCLNGILCDVYPLNEKEIHEDNYKFFTQAYKKLVANGVLTYYSDEEKDFSPAHLQKLITAGFLEKNISGIVVPVTPPKDCQYWKAKSFLAPIIIK